MYCREGVSSFPSNNTTHTTHHTHHSEKEKKNGNMVQRASSMLARTSSYLSPLSSPHSLTLSHTHALLYSASLVFVRDL